MVAGVGFFTDAYDLFAISIASTMLGYVYSPSSACRTDITRCQCTDFVLGATQDFGIKVAAAVGNVFGQLLFGWLADALGRKRMYGIELIIVIFATFTQALSANGGAINIIGALVVWRFILGVGVGGDYPLSAVISSEFASTRTRGRLMTAVFANQGWGQLTAAIVAIIVVAAFQNSMAQDIFPFPGLDHVDYMWRILIGLGCIPACVALYFRLTIPETPRFTMDIERNITQALQDIEITLAPGKFYPDPDEVVIKARTPRATRRDFIDYFSRWENGKILLAAAYSWFALDIAFYGLGLNSSNILNDIGFADTTYTNVKFINTSLTISTSSMSTFISSSNGTAYASKALNKISEGNIILSLAGLIPGYWVSFMFIDTWGRKPIQLMGFIVLTVLFLIMGFGYHKITSASPGAFVFLYCLANFFQNFGPNTTPFIVPGEAFPTCYRSTAHGICSASGKIGAVIAQIVFYKASNGNACPGNRSNIAFEVFAFFMLTGVLSTFLLPETKGRTLEDVSNENQQGFVRSESIEPPFRQAVHVG